MAYNWAQLAFVEKWRLHAVRGQIIGMHHPFDRTLFELRLRPGEGNVGPISSPIDVQLQDAGNIILEKRIGLMQKASVVLRVAGRAAEGDGDALPARPRRLLEAGSVLAGKVVIAEGDVVVLDAGFPVVAQLPEPLGDWERGQTLYVSVTEIPKGFLVV